MADQLSKMAATIIGSSIRLSVQYRVIVPICDICTLDTRLLSHSFNHSKSQRGLYTVNSLLLYTDSSYFICIALSILRLFCVVALQKQINEIKKILMKLPVMYYLHKCYF